MKYVLLAVLIASPALAQIVSFGVKAGVLLGDAFTSGTNFTFTSEARRYLVGGTVEAHLPLRLSVELDAIYKRTGFTTFFQSLDLGHFSNRIRADQWEFPVLAKYEILGGHVRPFVDAGPVLRHISGVVDTSTYLTFFPAPGTSGSSTINNSVYLQHRNSPGFAIGGGVTLKFLHLRLSPEVRYTRWGTDTFSIGPPPSSNPNQEDLMVGFTF